MEALASFDHHFQAGDKRKRLRKGTHSCWECKRRKMKCIFEDGIICQACRRRASRCVTQEFPEDVESETRDTTPAVGARRETNRTSPTSSPRESPDGRLAGRAVPTPVSIVSEPQRPSPQHVCFDKTSDSSQLFTSLPDIRRSGKHGSLSALLHASLPSPEDTERICRANSHPSILPHEIMTVTYAELDQSGSKTIDGLSQRPGLDTSPVLIARYMLLLATVLQHLHPDLHQEIRGLSEQPRVIMARLADLAVRHVTTDDALTGSIEGLECVIIESVYQANLGNLRRSWISCRRAMAIAQLMGLNRSDHKPQYQVLKPETRLQPQQIWFRIVFLDRFLCLMLGLSQGSLDRSMASEAALASETPIGRLERIHCVVASRILERNESQPNPSDLALTRSLDEELQRGARSLPGKWWLAPVLNVASGESSSLFWDTRRLFAQMLHYNLLIQLHLPYLLRDSTAERQLEYSRITCINASREILSRVVTLRSFNGVTYSCRIADFLVLMAALTLLLAHLCSHQSGTKELLSHQYYTDRAMIEQVQEVMEDVHRVHADALSAQSADLLRSLLAIEMRTDEDNLRNSRRVSVQEVGTETMPSDTDDAAAVSVHIPYFGIIKIAREGISKEMPRPQAANAPSNYLTQSQNLNTNGNNAGNMEPASNMRRYQPAACASIPNIDVTAQVTGSGYDIAHASRQDTYPGIVTQATGMGGFTSTQSAPPLQDDFLDPFWQYGEYPGLVAGGEDWALQGTDWAFFDTLMRSNGNEMN